MNRIENRKGGVRIALLLALCVVVVACEQQQPSDAPFEPCGGDVLGAWRVDSLVGTRDTEDPDCEAAQSTHHFSVEEGVASFGANGAYFGSSIVDIESELVAPLECLRYPCDVLESQLRTRDPAARCISDDDTCSCEQTSRSRSAVSGTYEIVAEANALLIRPASPTIAPTAMEYCVRGNQLLTRDRDGVVTRAHRIDPSEIDVPDPTAECESDSDCPRGLLGGTRVCDASQRCVDCVADDDCTSSSPFCVGEGADAQCSQCREDVDCPSERPTCGFGALGSFSGSVCLECAVDSDCNASSGEPFCNGGNCMECREDSDCTSADAPICVSIVAVRVCGECDSNDDCPSSSPTCQAFHCM